VNLTRMAYGAVLAAVALVSASVTESLFPANEPDRTAQAVTVLN
jgi:hypothetical protein